MVDYQTFIGIVQEVATAKGLSGEGTGAERQALTSDAADYWNSNTATVKGWTEAEAREWAREKVRV